MASNFSTPQLPTPPSLTDRLQAPNPVSQVQSYQNQALAGLTSGLTGVTGGVDRGANLPQLGFQQPQESSVQLGSRNVLTSVAEDNKRLAQLHSINEQKKITQGRVQGYGNVGNIGGTGLAANYGGPNPKFPNAIPQNMAPVRGGYLRRDAASAFEQMAVALKSATGANLRVNEGYRTYARQVYFWNLYKSGKGAAVAPPGKSTHSGGTAVDMGGFGGVGTPAWNWLRANAGRYGYEWTGGYQFKNSAGIEPWHWQYQG